MNDSREVAEALADILSEPVDYYPDDMVPPFIESPLDSAKYDNGDMTLEEAVELNGGRFFMCNKSILTNEW
ncbi:MAG: hypothetical protein FWB85_01270 [Chitinispirillia bacterium]|nr:hypothetical protein [Chitinispirillia bacterium]MCL2241288.1 hypothetical protein [Chitinispirillia bacterium]